MWQRSSRTSWGAIALILVGLSVGGCSGSDDDPGADGPSPTASSAAPAEVASKVSLGQVAGRLPKAQQAVLLGAVQPVVDGWIDAAYLEGDYPRTDFSDSFPGFTAGARTKAMKDADLMSNRDLGPAIDGVEPKRRVIRLDVVSVKQRPVGVTAHVLVTFATTGDTTKKVRVGGRLFLTKGKQGWQVFGYDVAKDVR
jgi:hypothetical protein